MKPVAFLVSIIFYVHMSFGQAEVQSGLRPWMTTGNNNTVPATNFLGTTNAQDLVIRTTNVERLRVLSGGNVGIGIAAPTQRLHVFGNLRFDGALMPANLPGTAGQVLRSQGAGIAPVWGTIGSYSLTSNDNLPDNFNGACANSNVFTNNTAVAIPDVSTVNITFPVAALPTSLCGVILTINLTHTWDSDLDISLVSPLGTSIDVSSDNGSLDDNYTNTTFDDNAATPITAGFAPFTGTFRPEVPFSTLNGQNPNGNWTLVITDDLGGDAGTFLSATLTLLTASSGTFTYVGETAVPIVAGETANVECNYSVKTASTNGIVVRVTRDVVTGAGSVGTVIGYCADSGPTGTYSSCGISERDPGLAAGTYYYKLWEYIPGSVAGTKNYSLTVNKN